MVKKTNVMISRGRGSLISVEAGREIPFDIKRTFFLFNMPIGAVRGNHANMNGQCAIVLLAGEAEVEICDGLDRKIEVMDRPGQYVSINSGVWHKVLNRKSDTFICVVASNRYDEADYESDYKEYMRRMKGNPNV